MTFTYDLNAPGDPERVRFHLGDTDASAPKFQDEEIGFILAEAGSWQLAVIACIKNMIVRLSQPDFTADWLRVDHGAAREGFERMLANKEAEFGIGSAAADVTYTYRIDSDQTEAPYQAEN